MALLDNNHPASEIDEAGRKLRRSLQGIYKACKSAKDSIGTDYQRLINLPAQITAVIDLIQELKSQGYTENADIGPALANSLKSGDAWADIKPSYNALKASIPPLRAYLIANVGTLSASYGPEDNIIWVTDAGVTYNSEVTVLLDAILENFKI